jgi:membrane-associated phospholipid phosphatase
MDSITAAALSINDPIVRMAGELLDSEAFFVGMLIALILLGEGRNQKRKKIAVSVALAILCGYAVKWALAVERPCAGESWCPEGYSFPSLHATAAFALMIGFLNKKIFPALLLFALFTAFTRMNLGVHTFADIAAALPIAVISYYATDLGEHYGKRD